MIRSWSTLPSGEALHLNDPHASGLVHLESAIRLVEGAGLQPQRAGSALCRPSRAVGGLRKELLAGMASRLRLVAECYSEIEAKAGVVVGSGKKQNYDDLMQLYTKTIDGFDCVRAGCALEPQSAATSLPMLCRPSAFDVLLSRVDAELDRFRTCAVDHKDILADLDRPFKERVQRNVSAMLAGGSSGGLADLTTLDGCAVDLEALLSRLEAVFDQEYDVLHGQLSPQCRASIRHLASVIEGSQQAVLLGKPRGGSLVLRAWYGFPGSKTSPTRFDPDCGFDVTAEAAALLDDAQPLTADDAIWGDPATLWANRKLRAKKELSVTVCHTKGLSSDEVSAPLPTRSCMARVCGCPADRTAHAQLESPLTAPTCHPGSWCPFDFQVEMAHRFFQLQRWLQELSGDIERVLGLRKRLAALLRGAAAHELTVNAQELTVEALCGHPMIRFLNTVMDIHRELRLVLQRCTRHFHYHQTDMARSGWLRGVDELEEIGETGLKLVREALKLSQTQKDQCDDLVPYSLQLKAVAIKSVRTRVARAEAVAAEPSADSPGEEGGLNDGDGAPKAKRQSLVTVSVAEGVTPELVLMLMGEPFNTLGHDARRLKETIVTNLKLGQELQHIVRNSTQPR